MPCLCGKYQITESSNSLGHIGHCVADGLSTQMQQIYKQTTATRKQTKRQMQRINQTIEREKCGKLQNYEINARNLLGHVGRLLGVADELVLALRQPRDV